MINRIVSTLIIVFLLSSFLLSPPPTSAAGGWDDVPIEIGTKAMFATQYLAKAEVLSVQKVTDYTVATAMSESGMRFFFVVVEAKKETFRVGYTYEVRGFFRGMFPDKTVIFDVYEIVSQRKASFRGSGV